MADGLQTVPNQKPRTQPNNVDLKDLQKPPIPKSTDKEANSLSPKKSPKLGDIVSEESIQAIRTKETEPVKILLSEWEADGPFRKKPQSYISDIEKLAEKENFTARMFTGACYSVGMVGTKCDPKKAQYWMERALELPHTEKEHSAILSQLKLNEGSEAKQIPNIEEAKPNRKPAAEVNPPAFNQTIDMGKVTVLYDDNSVHLRELDARKGEKQCEFRPYLWPGIGVVTAIIGHNSASDQVTLALKQAHGPKDVFKISSPVDKLVVESLSIGDGAGLKIIGYQGNKCLFSVTHSGNGHEFQKGERKGIELQQK